MQLYVDDKTQTGLALVGHHSHILPYQTVEGCNAVNGAQRRGFRMGSFAQQGAAQRVARDLRRLGSLQQVEQGHQRADVAGGLIAQQRLQLALGIVWPAGHHGGT